MIEGECAGRQRLLSRRPLTAQRVTTVPTKVHSHVAPTLHLSGSLELRRCPWLLAVIPHPTACAILVVMEIGRRGLVSGAVAIVLGRLASAAPVETQQMYGLIGSMSAVSGRRDDVIAILTEAVSNMPGCLSYVVAKDSEDENTIWVTEVWDNKESHDASLSLPSVTKAISAARPMISAFGKQVITTPVGGYGLPATKPH